MPLIKDKSGHYIGVPKHLEVDVARLPLKIESSPGRFQRLYQSLNDGHLEYCLEDLNPGRIWRLVTPGENLNLASREYQRVLFANDWVGKYVGKTIIIMGTGPQMKLMSKEVLKHLAGRNDVILCGVNAIPATIDRVCGIDPSKVLDFMVAADAVFDGLFPIWGWDKIPKVQRFIKGKFFDDVTFPLCCRRVPSLSPLESGGWDSITHALNIAINSLCDDKFSEKYCGGPARNWPVKYMQSGRGRIILVGVEHNKFNHAYTDREDFYIPDQPNREWPDMGTKHNAHRIYSEFAKEMTVEIYNAAPWSAIQAYDFIDLEEFLDIPGEIRTGISKGEPEVGDAVYDSEDLNEFFAESIEAENAGLPLPTPPKPLRSLR